MLFNLEELIEINLDEKAELSKIEEIEN